MMNFLYYDTNFQKVFNKVLHELLSIKCLVLVYMVVGTITSSSINSSGSSIVISLCEASKHGGIGRR